MKIAVFVGLWILISNTLLSQSNTEYLQAIQEKLNEIKSISYYNKTTSSVPGDTTIFLTHESFIQMYINPADTILGASYSGSIIDDITKIEFCYDGRYIVRFDWDNRIAQVDTIANLPYGIIRAPFFIRIKSLVEYAIQNTDSSTIKYHYYQDSTRISFYFSGKWVEFIGLTPFIIESPEKVSRYELWVDKNYVPYKFIRKMTQHSVEICTDVSILNELEWEFNAIRQIPADFTIKGREKYKIPQSELKGQLAADWKLKEIYGDSISIKDLKSKILLIQFTGIGCGPCHAAIPFLKQLVIDNMEKDFELVSIETWSKNISGIQRYNEKNELNYKVLLSNKDVNTNYKVQGVPVFFILDEKRTIKKVVLGYRKGVTEKEIIGTINELF